MKDNNLLKKYKSKIKIESLIKSLIYGLISGFLIMILLSIILYLIGTKNVVLVIIVGIITTIASAILLFIYKFNPSLNKVANRIDELGLHERIITMVEFSDRDEYIYNIQRQDASEKIKSVEPKKIKFKFSKFGFIILGIALILSAFTFSLPDKSSNNNSSGSSLNNSSSTTSSSNISSSSSSSSSSEELDEDEIIKKLLEELRNIIFKAGIDEDVKEDLYAIVDQLEIDLESLDTLAEKIAAIEEKRQEIKDRIAYELLRMSLGRALQQYDMTKELGAAIYQEDLDKVDTAIQNLIFVLSTSENVEEDTRELANYLIEALEIADKEKNEALIEAVRNFADSLLAALGETQTMAFNPHKHLANDGDANEIIEILTNAGEEIKDALRKSEETQVPEQGEENPDDPQEGEQDEKDVQDAGDQMDSAMEEAKDALEDLLDKEQAADDGNDGIDDSDNGEQTPPPTLDDTPIDSETVIDGETPYLGVYDEFLDMIIDMLESGEDIPDEYKELIERYFDIIGEDVLEE